MLGALALGVMGSLGMLVLADEAIVLLFGERYAASAAPARILFLALPFVLLHYVLTTLANALRLERLSALLLAGGTALNLALNLFAIPRYGLIGAAWMTVISQFFLAASLLWVTARQLASRATASSEPPGAPPEPQ
jgi:O-antigen/teichoic acid export membrane protein